MAIKTCGRAIKCLAFVGLAALAAAEAEAGFTHVNATGGGAELGHAAILSHAYGGAFAAEGVNFSNGAGLIAERCADYGDGAKPDQCWDGAIVSARVIARFAGHEQTLGVLDGEHGGSFRALFTVAGQGLDVAGSAAGPDLAGRSYRFARGGGGHVLSSLQADNGGAADQMVSYRLAGPAGAPQKFVLFFEDLGADEGSDWDYNDLVVEVTTAGDPAAVPLPPAVWSGLTVLLTSGLWGGRARLRRWFT